MGLDGMGWNVVTKNRCHKGMRIVVTWFTNEEKRESKTPNVSGRGGNSRALANRE